MSVDIVNQRQRNIIRKICPEIVDKHFKKRQAIFTTVQLASTQCIFLQFFFAMQAEYMRNISCTFNHCLRRFTKKKSFMWTKNVTQNLLNVLIPTSEDINHVDSTA